MPTTPESKPCSMCREDLPLEKFTPSQRKQFETGKMASGICKSCKSEYDRRRREKMKCEQKIKTAMATKIQSLWRRSRVQSRANCSSVQVNISARTRGARRVTQPSENAASAPTAKPCSKCEVTLPLDHFTASQRHKKENGDWKYGRCKSCVKDDNLRNRYKITTDNYNQMRENQTNACEMCKFKFLDESSVQVDHHHGSGEVRALLCRTCNVGLGHFQEDIERIINALRYVIVYNTFQPEELAGIQENIENLNNVAHFRFLPYNVIY